MTDRIETYLRRVATTGCGVEELGAAVRICKAGWSAQLDGTPLLDGVDFVKTGNLLFARIRAMLATENDAAAKCLLLALMHDEMTGVGSEWSSRKDDVFVNAFLTEADGCWREACREDGLLRALLCRVSAYYLYCQEEDTNLSVRGFVDSCIDGWRNSLTENLWDGVPVSLTLERLAAMQSAAQTDADVELMSLVDEALEKCCKVVMSGHCGLNDLACLYDMLTVGGHYDKAYHCLGLKPMTRSDSDGWFVRQSMIFASECRRAVRLSAV